MKRKAAFLILCLPLVAQAIPEPKLGTTLSFPEKSVDLSSTHQSVLRGLARELGPEDKVEIIGLPSAGERSSEKLSRERADGVRRYLTRQGVDRARTELREVSRPRKPLLKHDSSESPEVPAVQVQIIRSIEPRWGVDY